jgi:hypothetical protein
MGPPPRRTGILDSPRRLPAQAVIRNWRLRLNVHLWILRRKLEGEHEGALSEAIKWDGSSGGVIRMVVLTGKGAQRHLYLPDQNYDGPGKQ